MSRQAFDTVDVLRLEIAEGAGWLDVLGPTHELKVTRNALDIGTLAAIVLDSSLDPAKRDLIRPGRPVRLMAYSGSAWTPLFVGKISTASVTYALQHPDSTKRARISLSAVDAVSDLANVPKPEGVAVLDDLRFLLPGSGVPYRVNGSDLPMTEATVVARNENASLLDQISITRDSVLGYAWVDRTGTLVAYDAASIPTASVADLDESAYSDLDIGFNTEQVINTVNVKYLRINLANQETVEIAYGPYVDEASVASWGPASQEFTISLPEESAAAIEAYAAKILSANATPRVRINSVALPIRTTDAVAAHALLDLYDAVTVSNQAATMAEISRITGLEHSITQAGWTTRLLFSVEGAVAAPYRSPAPPVSESSIRIGPQVAAVEIRVDDVETATTTLSQQQDVLALQVDAHGLDIDQALADAAAAQAAADTNAVNVQKALDDAAAAMAAAEEGGVDQATRDKIDEAFTKANTSLNGVNELNTVTIPDVRSSLDNINTVQIPDIRGDLTGLDTALVDAQDEIVATNSRLNTGGDVATAISDAAASPVTDERLTARSLTIWPFAGQAIPENEITFRELAAAAVRAKNLNINAHVIY